MLLRVSWRLGLKEKRGITATYQGAGVVAIELGVAGPEETPLPAPLSVFAEPFLRFFFRETTIGLAP